MDARGAYARHSRDMENLLYSTQVSLDRARERLDTKNNQLREARQEARVYKRKRDDLFQKYEQKRRDELEKAHNKLTDRLEELEDGGDDLQTSHALLSDDDDYESDEPEEVTEREMAGFVVDEDEEDPEEPAFDDTVEVSSDDTH